MAALGVIGTPSAGAATVIGETFAPTDNCSPRTRIQSGSPGGQYAAPFTGVITSWRFQASSAGGASPLRLKVARHAGGDNFTIVGESEFQAIPDSDAFLSFPVRISVQAGDVIGVSAAPASVFLCRRTATGYGIHESAFGQDTPLGVPTTFTPVGSQQLDVSAVLEPDCDADGFGDETQDGDLSACQPGDSLAPTAAITKGPKNKTKKKRATFEFTGTDARAIASFQCSLDGAVFTPCTSPHTVKVKKGKHNFRVSAIDHAGNVGGPARDDWKRKKRKKK